MAGATCYGALIEVGRLAAGDYVVITAASGSVGLAALQVANRTGAIAIATTRQPEKRERLLRAGAAHVIVTTQEPLAPRIRELTQGRGARLVFDPMAGPSTEELAASVAPGGKLILYGFLGHSTRPGSFAEQRVAFPMSNWSIDMRWYALGIELALDRSLLQRVQHYVLSGMRSGALAATIDRTFDFKEIVAAHRYLESNVQVGKVVVTLG
jgi:NADPH:quinone reductase-like Zn-dependent oxidoreductase